MSIFDISQYRNDGLILKQERMATKKSSAKLNPVLQNNRFKELDFPDWEPQEYPKMIKVPMPLSSEMVLVDGKKVALPDEEELPVVLRRKVTEWEDDHGQMHQRTESDKAWVRRVTREWPMYYPVAQDAKEEAQIRADWGLTKTLVKEA